MTPFYATSHARGVRHIIHPQADAEALCAPIYPARNKDVVEVDGEIHTYPEIWGARPCVNCEKKATKLGLRPPQERPKAGRSTKPPTKTMVQALADAAMTWTREIPAKYHANIVAGLVDRGLATPGERNFLTVPGLEELRAARPDAPVCIPDQVWRDHIHRANQALKDSGFPKLVIKSREVTRHYPNAAGGHATGLLRVPGVIVFDWACSGCADSTPDEYENPAEAQSAAYAHASGPNCVNSVVDEAGRILSDTHSRDLSDVAQVRRILRDAGHHESIPGGGDGPSDGYIVENTRFPDAGPREVAVWHTGYAADEYLSYYATELALLGWKVTRPEGAPRLLVRAPSKTETTLHVHGTHPTHVGHMAVAAVVDALAAKGFTAVDASAHRLDRNGF